MSPKTPKTITKKYILNQLRNSLWFTSLSSQAVANGLTPEEWKEEININLLSLWKKYLQAKEAIKEPFDLSFYFDDKKLYSKVVFANNWEGFQQQYWSLINNRSHLKLGPQKEFFEGANLTWKGKKPRLFYTFPFKGSNAFNFYERDVGVNKLVHLFAKKNKRVMILDLYAWMEQLQKGFSEFAYQEDAHHVYSELKNCDVLILDNFVLTRIKLWFFKSAFYDLIIDLLRSDLIVIIISPKELEGTLQYLQKNVVNKMPEGNLWVDFFSKFIEQKV